MFRIPEVSVLSSKSRSGINNSCLLKAKFHYASWFGACSELDLKLVRAKFHYTSWFGAGSEQVRRTGSEPAPNYIRTSSEQASVMEFVFYTRY